MSPCLYYNVSCHTLLILSNPTGPLRVIHQGELAPRSGGSENLKAKKIAKKVKFFYKKRRSILCGEVDDYKTK
jgi:hypothetical protein